MREDREWTEKRENEQEEREKNERKFVMQSVEFAIQKGLAQSQVQRENGTIEEEVIPRRKVAGTTINVRYYIVSAWTPRKEP